MSEVLDILDDDRLTIPEAAKLLGVCANTMRALLDGGKIPFEQPCKHRRIRRADVLRYRRGVSSQVKPSRLPRVTEDLLRD